MSKKEIKILDDRAQAREKLPIWFGSRDNYTHGIKELIANAADEIKNHKNEGGKISVRLHSDSETITVRDNGTGIPIYGKTNGYDNYFLLFEKLFSGTKYDVTDSTTTGTNGVGNTVLNYTSEEMIVNSYYDGMQHTVHYKNGGYITKDKLVSKKSKEESGTEITVKLDKDIYTKTKFVPKEIEEIVQHFAVATLGVEFKFIDETKDVVEEKVFLYDSYNERFEELVEGKTTSGLYSLGTITMKSDIEVVTEKGMEKVEEVNSYNIQITTMPEAKQESYLNMTFLEQGGTINNGILDGVRLFLNRYCRENKLFPKNMKAFTKEDIEFSIGFLAIVESNNVEFSNQTKLSTNKEDYGKQAKKYVDELMDRVSIEQPKTFKKMVNHVLSVAKHNNANNAAVKKLNKKLQEKVDTINTKIKKLIDCEVHGLDAELYITEGNSANGSIVDARDDEFQASYPLRGKFINSLKASYSDVFSNEEAVDLIRAIGAGIYGSKNKDNDFKMENVRYGKIIIATDADPDGDSIAALIITFIYKYLRPMLYNNMVYIARTPLYELKFEDDSVVYFNSEKEKDDNIGKYKNKKYKINRLKGLGEVDAHIMNETAMNPETRNLIKVTIDDVKKAEDMLLRWMDDDVQYRKEMINEQLHDFIDLSE